jgi:hypothetical protein
MGRFLFIFVEVELSYLLVLTLIGMANGGYDSGIFEEWQPKMALKIVSKKFK